MEQNTNSPAGEQPDFGALHRQYDTLDYVENDILTDTAPGTRLPGHQVFSERTRSYFDRNVAAAGAGGQCRRWTGKTDRNGCPWIKTEKGLMPARQFAWEMAHGELPADHVLINDCGDRMCLDAGHMKALRRQPDARPHQPPIMSPRPKFRRPAEPQRSSSNNYLRRRRRHNRR